MAGFKSRASDTSVPLTEAAYAQYSAALNRYLVHRVRQPEDASDLSQEIFELFLRRRARPEAIDNPLGYLFRIAFHVVSDALSRQKRDPLQRDSRLLDATGAQAWPSSADHAEELAVQQDVIAALETLPQNHLTTLMLVDGEGMSYAEAARASGFAVNTIRAYLAQARAALKLALDGARKTKDRSP